MLVSALEDAKVSITRRLWPVRSVLLKRDGRHKRNALYDRCGRQCLIPTERHSADYPVGLMVEQIFDGKSAERAPGVRVITAEFWWAVPCASDDHSSSTSTNRTSVTRQPVRFCSAVSRQSDFTYASVSI
jgi:hypothetical protein